MKRRQALKIVTLGALAKAAMPGVAARGLPASCAWTPGDYRLAFFTEDDNRLVDELMEMIIPADAHSPGAHAAQVSLFADLMISTGEAAGQHRWRRGIQAMRDAAAQSSTARALAKAAAGESHPETDLDHFFIALKRITVDGYYTSEIGIHQDLNYQGNAYLGAFPGCGHGGHS
ncbi:MAG TPA: gluconate 2-dehydrogenase subunit 3 family protein [Terriglobia bacterium]|nr:gluconate 2-dehydrogenase subunit 3 family protein [Terriglobia bacterium]